MKKNITIAGAGLVGSLCSLYMRKRGFDVSIYERRDDLRLAEIRAGKSINLALSVRGWTALKKVGVDKMGAGAVQQQHQQQQQQQPITGHASRASEPF